MSLSETDSEPEPDLATNTVPSLTAFARLSTTRPSQGLADQTTVSWAVDTLVTLDFRLIRQDATLHGLIQNCAGVLLDLFDTVLEQGTVTGHSFEFISDVASILRPSFIHLLFQYRRLFRVMAARDIKPNSLPLATICWVDVVLARLGDVIAFIAAGLDRDHLDKSLPESLKAWREDDSLRAAMQLPDNWDMLPSMLLSERVSVAAKRLSITLMLGKYILCPALLGQVGVDNTIRQLYFTFAEFVKQRAHRVNELRSVSGFESRYFEQRERLTDAMAVTLFAAADIGQDSIDGADPSTFRPKTIAAATQLLRFVLNEGGYSVQRIIPIPPDHLDIPARVVIQWGVVPQWAWNIWLEYRSLYADTIMCITTTYIQHYNASSGVLLDLLSTHSKTNGPAAVISVIIDLVFRFISKISTGGDSEEFSTTMMNILHRSCQLISQWMNLNSCGIQNSVECCKALIVLFGYLCQGERHFALNDIVIECLAYVRGRCSREAWKAAVDDNNFRFLEALDQSFVYAKSALSRSEVSKSKSSEIHATQLMQFLAIMISKKVNAFSVEASIDFIQAVKDRVLEMPPDGRELLCETFLVCLAAAKISEIDTPLSKFVVDASDAIWGIGMSGRGVNFSLASAFSLYIASTFVDVEPLTYLEGMEYLLDLTMLICGRSYPREDEPLALTVLPTIIDALEHLSEHRDDATGGYVLGNAKMLALGSVLRSLGNEHGTWVERRVWSAAERVLLDCPRTPGAHELVFFRAEGTSHLLYIRGV